MITSLIGVAGAVLAAVITANLGIKNYREQKREDRQHDLVKRKQQEYERYLTAFYRAARWKDKNKGKHAEAEADYHEAHNNLLLVGADAVIVAANAFHRYYTDATASQSGEVKHLYAKMIIAMREDGFEVTSLSTEEVAKNIPWTIKGPTEELPGEDPVSPPAHSDPVG
jgi:hypothetical protein